MVDQLLDRLDRNTVLRVEFCNEVCQFVFQFPSGLLVMVWGDSHRFGDSILVSRSQIVEVVDGDDNIKAELVPVEKSPFGEEYSKSL